MIETGNPWLVRLAILAVVMSVVSLYYYIRFIRAMYIEPEAEAQPVLMAAPLRVAMVVAVLLVVFIGVYPQPVISFTQRAAASPGFRTAGSPPPTPPAQAAPPGSRGQPAPAENDSSPMRLPPR